MRVPTLPVCNKVLAWAAAVALLLSCDQRDTSPGANHAPPANTTTEVEVAPALPNTETPKAMDKPLLWEVASASGAKSHVLGIYGDHTDFEGFEALPEKVRDTFEASERLVLEMDTGGADQSTIKKFVVLPEGKSLKKLLQPAQWDVLVKEAKLPAKSLSKLQPWVALSMVQQHWVPNPGVRGMNGRFIILGRAHEKKLTYLETSQDQAELMSQIVTADLLAARLDDPEKVKQRFVELERAFRAGDGDALIAKVFAPEEVEKWPTFYQRFYDERSARWADALAPILEQGNAFVALSAPHLLGDKGVVQLLSARGFTFKPF